MIQFVLFTCSLPFEQSFPVFSGLCFGLNNIHPDFVPSFQNASVIGLHTRRKWITDPEILEELFIHARLLRKHLINPA